MLGLCLSGGGARGAYQIGVCMALEEAGIFERIEVISGTSIGAVNAAMLGCLPVEKVKNIWYSIPNEVLHKTENFFKRAYKENTKFLRNGFYDLSVLRKVIKDNIDFEVLKKNRVFITLSDCGVEDGGISAIIKSTYRHYVKQRKQAVYSKLWEHSRSEILQQVVASCSIPLVFPIAKIDGKQYVDGGLYDNVPVKPLVDYGCDEIIVIHLDKIPYHYIKKYPNVSFHVFKSSKPLGMILKFDEEQSIKRFIIGYQDGLNYLAKNVNQFKRINPSL